jgi:hypothetical protein
VGVEISTSGGFDERRKKSDTGDDLRALLRCPDAAVSDCARTVIAGSATPESSELLRSTNSRSLPSVKVLVAEPCTTTAGGPRGGVGSRLISSGRDAMQPMRE